MSDGQPVGYLYREAAHNFASGSEQSTAYSINGGYDEVESYDSSGNDRAQATKNSVYIASQSYFNFGSGFSKFSAFGNARGHDRIDQQAGLTYAFFRHEWEEIRSI